MRVSSYEQQSVSGNVSLLSPGRPILHASEKALPTYNTYNNKHKSKHISSPGTGQGSGGSGGSEPVVSMLQGILNKVQTCEQSVRLLVSRFDHFEASHSQVLYHARCCLVVVGEVLVLSRYRSKPGPPPSRASLRTKYECGRGGTHACSCTLSPTLDASFMRVRH